MRRVDELLRLKRCIAEFEQCTSELADPVGAGGISWTRSERTELEELISQTLEDLRARRRVIEHHQNKARANGNGLG
jgi:hypothetical protein